MEILERYEGLYPFMHLIRVKVTSRKKPDLTGGITVEVAPGARSLHPKGNSDRLRGTTAGAPAEKSLHNRGTVIADPPRR